MLKYSDGELEYFKTIIEKKLNIAKEQLSLTKEAIKNDNQYASFNMLSEIDASNNYHLILYSKEVEALKFALKKIENKTYGICEITGKLIDKKRLEIIPETTTSIIKK